MLRVALRLVIVTEALLFIAAPTMPLAQETPVPTMPVAQQTPVPTASLAQDTPVPTVPAAQQSPVPTPSLAQGTPGGSCVTCHGDVLEEAGGDVHRAAGFTCVDCHGGDATTEDEKLSMDPAKGFLGAPVGIAVAQLCAKCHADIERMRQINPRLPTDQFAQYQTSVHGKLASGGNTKVATCSSCHGAHGVRHVNDPAAPVNPLKVVETCAGCHNAKYMEGMGIPTDQFEKYKRSIHGQKRLVERDVGAPACNTCHGNHGAAPPGVSAVSHICGTCHATQAELFEASSHAKYFRDKGAAPCTTCHGNHEVQPATDELIGTEEHTSCRKCHEPGDRCDVFAGKMKQSLVQLEAAIDGAEQSLGHADRLAMDVQRPTYDLTSAREAAVRARVKVHSFSDVEFDKVIQEGMDTAQGVEKAAVGLLEEHQYRRKGLAVAAAALLIFAGLLSFKAKRIETERDRKR